MVGAKATAISEKLAVEAKERMRSGGGDKKSGKANLPYPIPEAGQTRDKIGKLVGVSGRIGKFR